MLGKCRTPFSPISRRRCASICRDVSNPRSASNVRPTVPSFPRNRFRHSLVHRVIRQSLNYVTIDRESRVAIITHRRDATLANRLFRDRPDDPLDSDEESRGRFSVPRRIERAGRTRRRIMSKAFFSLYLTLLYRRNYLFMMWVKDYKGLSARIYTRQLLLGANLFSRANLPDESSPGFRAGVSATADPQPGELISQTRLVKLLRRPSP